MAVRFIVAVGLIFALSSLPAMAQDQTGGPTGGQEQAQPYLVMPVLGLLGRLVEDTEGRTVAVVRDVVMSRHGGPVLAVLAVRDEAAGYAPHGVERHVAVPVEALRLPPGGAVRLADDAPDLATLPDVPAAGPISAVTAGTAGQDGLMVPAPEAGDLDVVLPQLADVPSADRDLPRRAAPQMQ